MFDKVIHAIRKRSFREFCMFVVYSPFYFYDKYIEHKFDQRYGTDTNQKLSLKEYSINTKNLEHACRYQAIKIKFFTKMIEQVSIDLKTCIFLDLGSGKGKSLMLATDYPFKQIIGVEFSPELHQIAIQNIDVFSRKNSTHQKIQLFCMDAEQYDLPAENIVLFLYNPFQGKVMHTVVKKIDRFVSNGQFNLIVLYRNPKCSEMFENSNFLNTEKKTRDYSIYSGISRCK
ncbi:MAG: class I SAM-dependent methyltransferase [Halioglobus sp.]